MYGEHPNGSMNELDSRNVDFLEDEFQSIGEVKKDLQLYELQQNLSLGKGEDLYTNPVTEDNGFPPDDRDSDRVPTVPTGGILSAQGIQPENKKSPQSLVDEHEDRPHSHKCTPQGVSGSDPSPIQGSIPRRKRRRDPEPEPAKQSSPRLIRRSKRERVP